MTNTIFLYLNCLAKSCNGTPYDNECCSSKQQCGINEGDCDSNDDCIGDLVCGKDNCPTHFPSDADCCQYPGNRCKYF